MSASKQKKTRSKQADGLDSKTRAAQEKAKKDKSFRRNSIIVTVIVVALGIAAILTQTNVFYKTLSAVKISSTSYNAVEFGYYYTNVYSDVMSRIEAQDEADEEYYDKKIDTTIGLDKQDYSDGVTWEDHIIDKTIEEMKKATLLYEGAVAAGYELSEEDEYYVDYYVQMAGMYASYYGYSSTTQYLAANYGNGMTEKIYRDILAKSFLGGHYEDEIRESFEYTDEELSAYYNENANSFDNFTFLYYYESISGDAYDDYEDDQEKLEAASEAAQYVASASDESEFSDRAEELSGSEASNYTYAGSNLTSYFDLSVVEWLSDSSRRNGDTFTLNDASGGSYALMFVERSNNDYNTVNVRHILIKVEADEDSGEYTDEALAAALEKIEEIYALWQENPTEEYFIELVAEYSEDDGSKTTGGLYEEIYKGRMVSEFDRFCFEGHSSGDTGIVYGASSSYEGYHLIYFVSEGEPYRNILARDDSTLGLSYSDLEVYVEDAAQHLPAEKKIGLKLANTAVY